MNGTDLQKMQDDINELKKLVANLQKRVFEPVGADDVYAVGEGRLLAAEVVYSHLGRGKITAEFVIAEAEKRRTNGKPLDPDVRDLIHELLD